MVIGLHISDFGTMLVGAQQVAEPVFERLDPPRRAAVVMALLGLALVGLFLITFVMVGGHWVRRLARHRPAPEATAKNAFADRQPQDTLANVAPDVKTAETVFFDTPSKDTKVQ